METNSIIFRLREFLEDEARSGSMDFGCVTPLYVFGCGEEALLLKR